MDHGRRKEVVEIIRAFAAGTGGPYDWDDFISPKRKDAQEQEVVDFCASMDRLYPSHSSAWCSGEGVLQMVELADLLESPVSFRVISDFIQSESKRARAMSPATGRSPMREPVWYRSRLFWLGLLGLGLLIWLWGYHLRMRSSLVVTFPLGECMIGLEGGGVHAKIYDPLDSRVDGTGTGPFVDFLVINVPLEAEPKAPLFAPALVFPESVAWFATHHGVVIAHWLVTLCYAILWLGGLVYWQRRKRRLMRGMVIPMAPEAG